MEAKDLANDTFFYEKLKASIPKLKDGEKDDVEVLKNESNESLTDDESDNDDDADDSDDEDDETDESDESSYESDGNEKRDDNDKSSLTKQRPTSNKNVEFIQNPNRALKEVEKAFHNNNKYIEEKQKQANDDDSDGSEEDKPVFKTKHFSRDFESTGDLLREVHSLVNKKKTEPDNSNGYWKIEYQNPTV